MNPNRNAVSWFEIYVQDIGRAVAFYEHMFQVKLEKLESPGREMWVFPSLQPDSPGCAGTLIKLDGKDPGVGGTLVYFDCADCGVEAARAARSGGKIHAEKMSVGQYGFTAQVLDTEGNLIGLHSFQ